MISDDRIALCRKVLTKEGICLPPFKKNQIFVAGFFSVLDRPVRSILITTMSDVSFLRSYLPCINSVNYGGISAVRIMYHREG